MSVIPKINRKNPLTRGLMFAGPFGSNQDRGALGVQSHDDLGSASIVGSSSNIIATRHGLARDTTGNTNGGLGWTNKKIINDDASPITFIAFASSTSSSSIRRFIGQGEFPVGDDENCALAINSTDEGNTNAGSFAMFMLPAWPAGTKAQSTGTSYADGELHWYGGSIVPQTSVELYFDGYPVATTNESLASTAGWTSRTDHDFVVGQHYGVNSGDSLDGTMVIAFAWNRRLTLAEHLAVTQDPWQLFEPEAQYALPPVPETSRMLPVPKRKHNYRAGAFNGTSQYVADTDPPIITATGGFTFGAWVRYRSFASADAIVTEGNNGSNGYWLLGNEATTGRVQVQSQQDDGTSKNAYAGNMVVGKWHYITGTWTDALRTAWLDGIPGTIDGPNSDTDPSVDFVSVGALRRSSVGSQAEADIADPAIWQGRLSAGEIRQLAAGADPEEIQPGSLRFYIPDLGGAGFRDVKRLTRVWDQTVANSPTQAGSYPNLLDHESKAVGAFPVDLPDIAEIEVQR